MSAGEAFAKLLEDYYQAWFRFHPLAAVEAGVEGYADQLPPYDDDEIGALVGLNEMFLASLDELDYAALGPDQLMDYRLAYSAALLENHELRESDWRHHNPARFIPLEAIHQLFMRPVANFEQAIEARLAQFPEYLRGARSHLIDTAELVPVLWLDSAIVEARSGAEYLRSLETHPRLASIRDRHTLVEVAARALEDYAHFLERDIQPQGL